MLVIENGKGTIFLVHFAGGKARALGAASPCPTLAPSMVLGYMQFWQSASLDFAAFAHFWLKAINVCHSRTSACKILHVTIHLCPLTPLSLSLNAWFIATRNAHAQYLRSYGRIGCSDHRISLYYNGQKWTNGAFVHL